MMRRFALALAALWAAPAEASCKLALALAMDISSSVDADEYRQQVEGLARALTHPAVQEAILQPEGSYIVAAAYTWSGYVQQDLMENWTVLDSPAAITGFAARIAAHPRPYAEYATALGKGVQYGAQLLASAPDCARQVIDVSGDGQNNDGVGPDYFVRTGLLEGITVNGLVIRGATPDPVEYYRTNVKHGPDAFVIVADGFSDYREAMTEKLLREIGADLVIGER